MKSLFLSLFLAPTSFAGTLVGHPVGTSVAPGSGVVFSTGSLPVSTTVFEHCDSTWEVVPVYMTLDPVAEDELLLPPGYICKIRINLLDDFTLSGIGSLGGTFDLTLDVGQIRIKVDPPIYVPPSGATGGTAIELAMADWVTAALLGLKSGQHVDVDVSHALHNTLRGAVRSDSSAW